MKDSSHLSGHESTFLLWEIGRSARGALLLTVLIGVVSALLPRWVLVEVDGQQYRLAGALRQFIPFVTAHGHDLHGSAYVIVPMQIYLALVISYRFARRRNSRTRVRRA
jgi:hypothetical protein